MSAYDNIRDTTGTCGGCPLTMVTIGSGCTKYCQDMADWLEEHDKQIRNEAVDDVKSWFTEEFKKQNNPNSKFVPSCVIKENIYDVLERIKENKNV